MAVWMVRAGRHGEQEQAAHQGNFVTIHWIELGDLSAVQDKEPLRELYGKAYPKETNERALASELGQVWAFCREIEVGNLAVLPLHENPKKPVSAFAVGRVSGPYRYRTDLGNDIKHVRSVEWIGKPIPAASFQEDLRGALGVPLTVYRISRNNADQRIEAALRGGIDPGPGRNTGTR
jgi:restriction system protein